MQQLLVGGGGWRLSDMMECVGVNGRRAFHQQGLQGLLEQQRRREGGNKGPGDRCAASPSPILDIQAIWEIYGCGGGLRTRTVHRDTPSDGR